MGRHDRRADMRIFRRSDLMTHLVDAGTPLTDRPVLSRAVLHWRGNIAARKPICISCKASFTNDDTKPGGYLFAQPISLDGLVSTSVICSQCWDTLSIAEIEAVSIKLLRKLAPGGCFLDRHP